jgi:hypothetical protein
MREDAPAPPISIVACTGRGWPAIEPYVRRFEAAAAQVGGEVIVADGSGLPPPPAGTLSPSTRWLSVSRRSVFQLRPLAIAATRAPIVAFTEDHCQVAPDWAARLLEVHAEHPEALVVGGAVDNSATERAAEWACYFTVQARCLPPVEAGRRGRLSHANISYRRRALENLNANADLGLLDAAQQEAARAEAEGQVGWIDPRPIVHHDQSGSLERFVVENFHAGRTYGGFLRAAGGHRRWIRLLATPAMPATRIAWVAAHGAKSRHRAHLASALPLSLLLLYAQAAGQAVGLLSGAGNSPLEVGG